MTKPKSMSCEEALEIAKDMLSGAAGNCHIVHFREECAKALDILRNGTEPVEVVKYGHYLECENCGRPNIEGLFNCAECKTAFRRGTHDGFVLFRETAKEWQTLKACKTTSRAVYEKVEE